MTGDERFMAAALDLARRGRGEVEPNPRVGAVAVRGDQIVVRGWHAIYGGPHAEARLLAEAGGDLRDHDVYLTLEPCTHQGKTPPCADALVRASPRRVVIASFDPNPRVAGRGAEALRKAGIPIEVGVQKTREATLNEGFRRHLASNRPWVIARWAMTLDGRLADRERASQWITGTDARADSHRLRAAVDGILVGCETALADDPLLTPRADSPPVRRPVRIVLDSTLRLPESSRLAGSAASDPVWIFCSRRASRAREERLVARGCKVFRVEEREGRPDLTLVLERLRGLGVERLLVEGGPTVLGAFLQERAIDQIRAYVAPRLLGDAQALPVFLPGAPRRLAEALELGEVVWRPVGRDLVVDGFLS